MHGYAGVCVSASFLLPPTPMKKLRAFLRSGKALATIVIAVVAVMTYCHKSNAPEPDGATENPVENDVVQYADEVRDEVLIGYSVEELRKMNNVREMMELEDGQNLSDANGVYGFVYSLFVNKSFIYRSIRDFDPLLDRDRGDNDIELHKTPSGETMLLLYVDEGSVARLAGSDQVGDIFVFFSPHKAHNVLVAVPISRIVNWDHRVSDPSFAKVRVN